MAGSGLAAPLATRWLRLASWPGHCRVRAPPPAVVCAAVSTMRTPARALLLRIHSLHCGLRCRCCPRCAAHPQSLIELIAQVLVHVCSTRILRGRDACAGLASLHLARSGAPPDHLRLVDGPNGVAGRGCRQPLPVGSSVRIICVNVTRDTRYICSQNSPRPTRALQH